MVLTTIWGEYETNSSDEERSGKEDAKEEGDKWLSSSNYRTSLSLLSETEAM